MSLPLSLFGTFVAGGLYALCYPSIFGDGWLPLLFIALPFFLWQLEAAKTLKRSLLLALAYNMGLNLVGYYWIPGTIREFGQLPYAISIFLGLFFAFILQPHWWAYILWKKWRPNFNWQSEKGLLITAFIMTFLERYLPQQFPSFTGSPWLHLAPYLGLVPYVGAVLFSFISYWVALEVVAQLSLKKFRPQVWITLVIFIVLNASFPLKEKLSDKNLNVRIVQANIGNFLKIMSEKGDVDSYESINKKYETLSTTENGFSPDLIVWPETAFPDYFHAAHPEVAPLFKNITQKTNSEMLIGGYDQNTAKTAFDRYETVYNSSVLISGDKVKNSYHKNILIPFGETLPFGPFNTKVVEVVPTVSLFARGTGTPKMETKTGYRFVTPICYEILETGYMRSLLNQWQGNHFIVNHTNDSWYGDTAEPHQHLFLSKWRALEFQLPIVRSTNTGITSIIYPDGSESERLGIGAEGILDKVIPMGTGENTTYQNFGVYPSLAIFLVLLLITWLREKN